jgi:25/26-hydroxycholesterol 7alpha-hydroxylase
MAILEFLQTHQILSVITLLLLFAYAYHILIINSHPSEPPLIKGYIPFFGATPKAIISPAAFLNSCKSRYGDIFTLYALGFRVTFVTDPIDGIPSVFKKSKELSFKAGLERVYTKVLGFTPERVGQEEMNREHFQMIPTYLLASSAVDQLTGRFLQYLLRDLRMQIRKDSGFEKGKVVDLFDWAGARLFYASGPALYGDGIFDGGDTILEDFRKFDAGFPMRLILPLWMTSGIAIARNRIQRVLSANFAKGLNNPSAFTQKRIEVCLSKDN